MVKKYLILLLLIIFSQHAPAFIMQKVIWKGPADKKEIALTFDDGPKPEYSQKVLDILTRYTVKATFFVVGKEAKDFPDIIMRMNDEGHEIGNHTYTHRNISVMPEEALKKELTKTNTVIFDITGKYPGLFRPPGGDFVFRTRSVASKCGLRQVNWSVNAGDFVKMTRDFDLDEDYEKTGRKLADSVIAKAGNGDIILFHNGSEETIRALPLIIESLRAKGYEFVTVSKMMSKGKS